jgi:hypothetical protein
MEGVDGGRGQHAVGYIYGTRGFCYTPGSIGRLGRQPETCLLLRDDEVHEGSLTSADGD